MSGPHTSRIDRDHTSVERITADDERMRGDNTKVWQQRAKPLLAFLDSGAKSLGEIKAWARRERHAVTVMEDALYWLEARGDVVRELGVWRVVRR